MTQIEERARMIAELVAIKERNIINAEILRLKRKKIDLIKRRIEILTNQNGLKVV